MLEVLKRVGTNLVLKIKGIFTSFESKIYVRDLRRVVVYRDGRKCKYPENYDHIVKLGKIKKNEYGNNLGGYELCYGGYKYNLISIFSNEKGEFLKRKYAKSYFTIKFLADKGKVNKNQHDDVDNYCGFYRPFKFKKLDLEKYLPIFEVDTNSLKLINSSILTKKKKNKEGKVHKIINEKGRNGELLYTSNYKKLSSSFFEIRDQGNNLELDKSLISVSIIFAAGLVKICAKLLTFIPIGLGGYLISVENLLAKSCGYLLFTPAIIVKNLVNIGSTIFKALILLLVVDKEKYGDAYLTMWNCQLCEYCKEFIKDLNIIGRVGKSEELSDIDYEEEIIGTWKELNIRRLSINKGLEIAINGSGGSINESMKHSLKKEKLQNGMNEKISEFTNHRSSNLCIRREQDRSDLQRGTPPRT
ncbi:hypothetical protein GOY13_01490 [Wolbachia endosymbiont of Cruorifilaria tuberocauda]|uniref:hypothetical protein n=1 Tax=Wolbachia endosymbiont of Cruorifilaria tuberocauda TaxID=1812111 RepID=UPI00158E8806|nr:hypothetical protein [Wolbachia endosymbiont of Cruorifilaria tuberocauda]QKX01618.1 hypothetical protein GOY13_01490 [Wolbachia endosymbiont of Cruorifilaria tuberocauda]